MVILPDNDKPGRDHAEAVARSLVGIAASVKILALPGLVDKQDVSDWLDAGHTVEELEQLADAAPDYGPPRPFLLFADIKPALDTRDFVEGLFTSSSLAMVYGEPGSRKTFWVLDICLHVASGREWSGRAVDRSAVLYCALEGGAGIRNRVVAARRRLGLPSDTAFVLMQLPIDLRTDTRDAEKLIELIGQLAQRLGLPVRMVVIDTLSRAMQGGNENGPEDMGAVISNADRIRFETGACVLFIHHSGKDATKGSRGHSSLKAATDTEIEVVPSDDGASSTATVIRQRDLDIGASFKFSLDVIELGSDRRGKLITSCVVASARTVGRPKLFGDKARAFDLLTGIIMERGELGAAGVASGIRSVGEDVWRDAFYSGALPGQKQDTKRKAFVRASGSLIDDLRLVGMAGGRVWLVRRETEVKLQEAEK